MPGGGAPFFRNLSVDNPTLYFVTALREALVANGIEVRGPAVDIDYITDPPRREDGVTLVTHRSAPLSALAVTMMKLSQNLYAETLLRTMGDREVRDVASGREAALTVLDGWQVDPLDVLLADGSGLSRYDLISANALSTVLARVAADATMGPTFEASLPVAGQDGTLAGRMSGTRAEGNARAKTGSFSNARAHSWLRSHCRRRAPGLRDDGQQLRHATRHRRASDGRHGRPPGRIHEAVSRRRASARMASGSASKPPP